MAETLPILAGLIPFIPGIASIAGHVLDSVRKKTPRARPKLQTMLGYKILKSAQRSLGSDLKHIKKQQVMLKRFFQPKIPLRKETHERHQVPFPIPRRHQVAPPKAFGFQKQPPSYHTQLQPQSQFQQPAVVVSGRDRPVSIAKRKKL